MNNEHWLFTPAETATAYVKWAEHLQNTPGINYGCCLDKVMIPLHPGDLMAVVGRPGSGKSAFAAYMAKRTALDIVRRKASDEVVIYVTWEQPVEEFEAFFQAGEDYSSTDLAWGRVDLDKVKRGAVRRPAVPIWLMGNSVTSPNAHREQMFVETVFDEIRNLEEEFGKRPVLICLDYLQKIPSRRGGERIQQVTDATVGMKDLAMAVGVPVIACVQAGRGTDARRDPIPTMADAQWSSAIEQTADKQIAVFRPIRQWQPDEKAVIAVGGRDYDNTPELFIVRLLKQRFEIGYGTFAVHFVPQTLELRDYAFEDIPLNEAAT